MAVLNRGHEPLCTVIRTNSICRVPCWYFLREDPTSCLSALQTCVDLGLLYRLWRFRNSGFSGVGSLAPRPGRAITQAVSRWLPTAAARVRALVWSSGICGGQSGGGAGFLRVLRFPLPIFIPSIAPQSPSSIIWGLYNRLEVAAVPSGLSPTPLIIKK
jgi:hypothetical protein